MRCFYTQCIFFSILLGTVSLSAQISFTNQTALLQNPDAFFSGVAVAIADMNGDSLDDIVRLSNASSLNIEYQAGPGLPFAHFTYNNPQGSAWAIAVADVNNDGFPDIFNGGNANGARVLTAVDNGANYQMQNLPNPGALFVQGSNFADINNDGWLDVFACHDNGESRIWGNDGSGIFFNADEWVDMATVPPSDNSGNYGSVWSDFDNDGDLDLYIAKCRIGVTNPEDPRRINALFVNDGQNNFHEAAAEYGLKIKWQSWTADFQDIDNDGDMDCLVTNHDYPLQLLENDGRGHFTDISTQAGISVSGDFIQGILRDFDNDGFVDIITAAPTYIFRNNGDKTFSQVPNPFGGSFNTLATGDLNHDGYLDLYTAYQIPYNQPSSVPDKLWMNNGGSNHFLKVNLRGVQSNRAGVGARIEIHGEWGIQVREVRAGESYGISNSLTQHFGLGQNTIIEYLVVRWPSGTVDVVKEPAADQLLTIEEGSTCQLADFELEIPGLPIICNPGETVEITAPADFIYLWNNGSVSQTLTVGSSGNFSVIIVNGQGCVASSEVVKVVESPDETPTVAVLGELEICQGSSVMLASSAAAEYAWSNGETTQSILVSQTGDYFVTIAGYCADFTSDTVHVAVYPAPAPQADDVTIFGPGKATLEASGNNLSWYDSPVATVPLATGPVFETPELTETTVFYVEDHFKYGGEKYEAGMAEVQYQSTPFNGPTFNGRTIFDVYQPIILKQVTVTTDSAGVRVIELLNANGNVLQSDTVNLTAGQTVVDLDFFIEPGTAYRLGANQEMNLAVLGTQSPRLHRSNQGVQYPYQVPGVLSITGNSLNAQASFYYFFNWQVELPTLECLSERVAVTVHVEPNAVTETEPFGRLIAKPNPSAGIFTLDLEASESGPAQLIVTDLTGMVVLSEKLQIVGNTPFRYPMDLSGHPAGMYFLKITNGQRAGSLKLVVSK